MRDEQRRRGRQVPTLTIDGIEPADVGTPSVDDQVVEDLLLTDLMSRLTDEQREVVELRFRQDLSLEETATRTGRSGLR